MYKIHFLILTCLAISFLLTSCGNLGSHSLNLRLQLAFDTTAIYIHNPTRATYFRTQVEVNDAFACSLGTLQPGVRYRLPLDSLRNDQGQRFSPRIPLDRLTCYAQDSIGNFDALIIDPVSTP